MQIIKNDDLEEQQELGSGTFGTVYHGKWRGTDVAIKRIKKSCFSGRSSEQERLVGLQCWVLHFQSFSAILGLSCLYKFSHILEGASSREIENNYILHFCNRF